MVLGTLTLPLKAADVEVRSGLFLESLMFHAQLSPSGSMEARWVLADALGQKSGIIDGLVVEEFQEKYGKKPTRQPALRVAVILKRSMGDGGKWLEYNRLWTRLDNVVERFQSVGIHVSPNGEVVDVATLDSVWDYWQSMTHAERV